MPVIFSSLATGLLLAMFVCGLFMLCACVVLQSVILDFVRVADSFTALFKVRSRRREHHLTRMPLES